MYYVRKLSKPSVLFKLQNLNNINELCADFLYQDMKTSNNKLSVWRSETLEKSDIDKAVHAALLASSNVNTSQFIVIDSNALHNAGIYTDDTQEGITAYKGLESLHTDLCDLTYEKIGKLIQVYCEISKDEARTLKIEKAEFKKIIIKVKQEGALDISCLQEHMKNEITDILKTLE